MVIWGRRVVSKADIHQTSYENFTIILKLVVP
jgi:hypothetical protein